MVSKFGTLLKKIGNNYKKSICWIFPYQNIKNDSKEQ